MNQEQRKFLIERVTRTHREQKEQLESKTPTKPSLNNYLVAACLDGSIKLNSSASIAEKIKQRVLVLGKNDLLIEESDDNYYSRKRSRDISQKISLEAEDVFVFPKAYLRAVAEYEKEKKEIDAKVKLLDSQKETIILKIQIGSNTSLDKLISQADNLVDLNLINNQLLLTN